MPDPAPMTMFVASALGPIDVLPLSPACVRRRGAPYYRRMPPDASDTRRKLLDAATRAFAEHGVFNASLLDITRQAGQRNRGALHYHFGSREGVLCAVLEEHVDFLAEREGELCEIAAKRPANDIESVVEAIVRPAAELGESGWRGRCFLLILAELIEEDPATLDRDVSAVLARTGGEPVYALLESRMPEVSPEVRVERLSLITMFILRAVADRARAVGRRGRKGRPQLEYEAFVRNLVAMVAAAVAAPDRVPGSRNGGVVTGAGRASRRGQGRA
jgi:AcrR family transcriptional regulator